MQSLPDDHDINHLRGALRLFNGKFNLAIDGGAHKGIWTKILKEYFKEVISIEPFHDCGIKAALGELEGRASLAPGKDNDGQYHLIDGDDVNVITLDSLGLEPDFIKLDIEGMELPALRGGKKTLKNHPALLIEMNGLSERYGYTDEDLVNYLTDLGYKQEGRWNKDYLFLYDKE